MKLRTVVLLNSPPKCVLILGLISSKTRERGATEISHWYTRFVVINASVKILYRLTIARPRKRMKYYCKKGQGLGSITLFNNLTPMVYLKWVKWRSPNLVQLLTTASASEWMKRYDQNFTPPPIGHTSDRNGPTSAPMMGAAKTLIYSNLSIQVGVALHLHLSALKLHMLLMKKFQIYESFLFH